MVIAHLASLLTRLRRDSSPHHQLEALRLVFMPIVNPGGPAGATRANPNGVDLMRNAPVEAQTAVPRLIGGQRFAAGLPRFRGALGCCVAWRARAGTGAASRRCWPRSRRGRSRSCSTCPATGA